MDLSQLAAEYVLSGIPSDDLKDRARELLLAGHESASLASLAWAEKCVHPAELRELFVKGLAEAGVALPDRLGAAAILKRTYARQVVEGSASAREEQRASSGYFMNWSPTCRRAGASWVRRLAWLLSSGLTTGSTTRPLTLPTSYLSWSGKLLLHAHASRAGRTPTNGRRVDDGDDGCPYVRALGSTPMSTPAETRRMTAAEYLVWEREQATKHEFHLGEVFAMAGASPRHNVLAAAMIAELGGAMRAKGCHVMTSDQRVSAAEGGRYVYPDAVVVCGGLRTEAGASDVLANPTVIVEVLSRATEAYDRGEKWEAYQRLSSLTDYVLVSQAAVRIEHYRREPDGSWRYREHGPGTKLTFGNGVLIAVDAVYQGAFEVEGD
jgi:Uma2 family endonuclease